MNFSTVLGSLAVVGLAVAVTVGVSSRPRDFDKLEPKAPKVAKHDPFREAELKRRPQRPDENPPSERGERRAARYDSILTHNPNGLPEKYPNRPVKSLPPTEASSVEAVPQTNAAAHRANRNTFHLFTTQSGFGVARIMMEYNDNGVIAGSPDIDRAELVSLLTDDDASVYVMEQMATPVSARNAKRRPLDRFEELGLEAVRNGADLVWSREAPRRMFGAIRARADCLECHPGANTGDLLGAFTYYLDTDVDKLDHNRRRPQK